MLTLGANSSVINVLTCSLAAEAVLLPVAAAFFPTGVEAEGGMREARRLGWTRFV